MGKANKALLAYVRSSLDRGYSFSKIEDDMVNRGYSRRAAEGVILSYRYRGNVFKWLTVVTMTLLFLLSLFLSGTGIIGMVTVRYQAGYENTLNITVNEISSYTWYPIPKGELVSVSATGNLIGDGSAKIYLENMGVRYLVFSSDKGNLGITDISSSSLGKKIKRFDNVCEESCGLYGFNKSVYSLVFEADNAVLEIEKLNFDLMVGTEIESLPEWSEIGEQKVGMDSELNIDLDSFFNASDERVVFASLAEDDSMNISIKNRIATIRPGRTGNYHAYFIAYVNGVKFVSNLTQIKVVNALYEGRCKDNCNWSGEGFGRKCCKG